MDTACSTTRMALEVVEEWSEMSSIRAVDGMEVECRGSRDMEMVTRNTRLKFRVVDRVVDEIVVVMRMDAIEWDCVV